MYRVGVPRLRVALNAAYAHVFWIARQLIISDVTADNVSRRLMGIRFNCPNGHKLNVKEFLAGKRGVCPQCGAKFIIPTPAEGAAMEVAAAGWHWPVAIG